MSSSKAFRSVVAVAVVVIASVAFAWSKGGEATVTFKATGPAGFKIDGKGTGLDVKDDGKALQVTVALKELDTGMGLRNKHMLEDLEAEKFPTVTLSVPLASLKVPDDGKSIEADGKGTFGMHGQTKELPFKYKASCKGGTCDIDATADLNMKDFGIKIRSYMGITVKNEVAIGAKFQVKK